MFKRITCLTMTCLLMTACVSGPYSENVTARTNGQGNWGTMTGLVYNGGTVAYVRQSYGVTKNLDVSILGETGNQDNIIGVSSKYALINKPSGSAIALSGGFGFSAAKDLYGNGRYGSKSGYYAELGPIFSYKAKHIEPYFVPRINYLHTRNTRTMYIGNRAIDTSSKSELLYGTATIGSNYWFTNSFALTVNTKTFIHHGLKRSFGAGLVFNY